jgi:hypothetical protein
VVQLNGAALGCAQPAEYTATAVLISKGTVEVKKPHLHMPSKAKIRVCLMICMIESLRQALSPY